MMVLSNNATTTTTDFSNLCYFLTAGVFQAATTALRVSWHPISVFKTHTASVALQSLRAPGGHRGWTGNVETNGQICPPVFLWWVFTARPSFYQRRAETGSWRNVHGCYTCQTCSWRHRIGQNGPNYGHVLAASNADFNLNQLDHKSTAYIKGEKICCEVFVVI